MKEKKTPDGIKGLKRHCKKRVGTNKITSMITSTSSVLELPFWFETWQDDLVMVEYNLQSVVTQTIKSACPF